MGINEYSINNIINYIRKSRRDEEREKRTGEDTLAEQTQLMKRVLDDMGIPYVQKFEVGSGDKISSRPVFQTVLDDLRAEKYDAIAVKEISRLGRGSYSDMGIIYDLLIEKKIYIITPWKIYDPTNSSDQRQIRFELFLSREEFETTRERLIGSRYSYAMQGKYMSGMKPFGYDFDKQTQKLVPNKDAEKVALFFNLYAYGVNGEDIGLYALGTYLQDIGIKTPKGKNLWSRYVLHHILSNPVYIGTVRFRITEVKNGKRYVRPEEEHIIVENAHEPIVDQKTWDIVQKKLAKYKFSYARKGKRIISPSNTPTYSLTGVVKCGVCGYTLGINKTSRKYKKRDGTESIYVDSLVRCKSKRCTNVKYETVEKAILLFFKKLTELDDQKLKNMIKNYIRSSRPEKTIDSNEEILKRIDQQLKSLEKRKNFIYEKFEDGIYTDNEFKERLRKVEEEKERIESSKKQLSSNNVNESKMINIEKFKTNLKHLLEIYDTFDDVRKNTILHMILDHVTCKVLKTGTKTKEAELELDIKFRYKFLIGDVSTFEAV